MWQRQRQKDIRRQKEKQAAYMYLIWWHFSRKKNRRGLACHCRVAYARVALRYWHAFGRVWSDTWIHDSLAKAQPKEAFIMGTRNDDHVLPSRKIALWLALPSGSSVGRAPSLKGAIQVRSTRGYFSYDAGGVTTFSPTEVVGLLT